MGVADWIVILLASMLTLTTISQISDAQKVENVAKPRLKLASFGSVRNRALNFYSLDSFERQTVSIVATFKIIHAYTIINQRRFVLKFSPNNKLETKIQFIYWRSVK